MNYACYCNTRVTGGGNVPFGSNDHNDELCNDLYKWYKCINIDYDHTGENTTFRIPILIRGIKTLTINKGLMLPK